MSHPLLLIIVGSSIFTLAVESALADLVDVRPTLIDPSQLESIVDELVTRTTCILLEKGTLNARQMWALMQQGHVLVEIDPATTTCTAFYGLRVSIDQGSDLQRLLQQLSARNCG